MADKGAKKILRFHVQLGAERSAPGFRGLLSYEARGGGGWRWSDKTDRRPFEGLK